MADIQVRCTLRAANGVTADDAINTFAVQAVEPGTDDLLISGAFNLFYNDTQPGSGLSISSFIAGTVDRPAGLRVELIESPQTPPNSPYFMATFPLDAPGADPLPAEVALCLSFHTADYLTSLTPGRERGRVYLGPLTVDALDNPTGFNPTRPDAAFGETVRQAAETLMDNLVAAGAQWALWSRASGGLDTITGGWVDDEFDTQRRRGRLPTQKFFWP